MSYTPKWTDRAEKTRQVLADIDLDRPESENEAAFYQLSEWAANSVRSNFRDVDPELLGWVLLDAAGGLRQLVDMAPDVPPHRLAALLMVTGKRLLEGGGTR